MKMMMISVHSRRAAEDEDDELGEHHELHRRHVERQHPLLDQLLAASSANAAEKIRATTASTHGATSWR